jgi:AAA15 family ATPase/GTPase
MSDTTTTPQPEAPLAEKPDSGLLLDSLEIENFRCFRHLKIPKLGRVNLITGKNNVGKSALLEGIWLYFHGFSPAIIRQVLVSREELIEAPYYSGRDQVQKSLFDESLFSNPSINIIKHLFFGRDISKSIHISNSKEPGTSLRLVERLTKDLWESIHKVQYNTSYEEMDDSSEEPHLIITPADGIMKILHLEKSLGVRRVNNRVFINNSNAPLQYVKMNGLSRSEVVRLWDRISLTEFENYVIESLKILHPGIQQLGFFSENDNPNRVAFIKIQGEEERVPIRSLGDGINRLLSLSLSLANSRNGIILLDEMDSGLHYSVLYELWRMIFETAKNLNIQIFATTHSWECIEAFQEAASQDNDSKSGMLIRLKQDFYGDIKAVTFDENELEIVTRQNIEVR